ncbi:lysoplasmalogenase [Nocardioides nitrophenolicus]|uniref:lysoplasmalogenase n=1 Tax=Nocardioides nitrophenolicus TaxID=60489 RepID=UPI00195D3D63|nr:lysoplasmalogenase [Nocardioides nitrophenolicus]MBM7515648.1 putative membrane protein YhhN [Nocardioides nitrophenolicus]
MRRSTKLELAYVALAAADTALAGSGRPWAHRARHVTKPLLLPALGSALATDARAQGSPLRTTTLLAQAGGWGGDVLLLGSGERAFAAGATSFGLGHLAYLTGFRRHRDRRTPMAGSRAARVVALLWAASGPVVAARAARQDRRLGGVVLSYSALLATTAAAATHLDPALPRDARLLTAAGGLTFLASDAVLGARTFLLPDAPARLESVVMATYTAAQLLLAEGAARAGR